MRAHDHLGWDNFFEGRICILFLDAYRSDLGDEVSPYRVDSWGRGFIERLVRITHSQWIFRNSPVHYKKLEGMTEAQHMDIFRRVEELMWEDPMDLLPAHRHLLEKDLQGLGECSSATRLYWVLSVEAAQKTAKHVLTEKATRDRYRMFMPRTEPRITTQATTRHKAQGKMGVYYILHELKHTVNNITTTIDSVKSSSCSIANECHTDTYYCLACGCIPTGIKKDKSYMLCPIL